MKEHAFTLAIAGDLDRDETLDALFEAGCDDATFGTIDGAGYGDFVREAMTFGEAVRAAIRDVETVRGLRVLRVEPDDLVTMREIAQRLHRSRESVRLLIKGERGRGGFPVPCSHLKARGRLWRWTEVADWAAQSGLAVEPHQGPFVAAINAALVLRDCRDRLTATEHRLLASLLPKAA